jgi:uncharacterized membrane protein
MLYIFEFFLFAFFGWIVDSLYTSLDKRRVFISGYFRGVPLCPIYGFGGILLFNSFTIMSDSPTWEIILFTTLQIITLEYAGGLLSERYLGERLWDYTKEPFNLHGYISVWHSFLWLLAVSFIYFNFDEKISQLHNHINSFTKIDRNLDMLFLFLSICLFLYATIKNKKLRLSSIVEGNS